MREIQNAFDQIRADEVLKASAKRAMKNARAKRDARPAIAMRCVAVMATLVICVLCVGSVSMLKRPVSYISIDVNPSIELSLNRLNRVVSAHAWNTEAEMVLQDVHTIGIPYTQAIECILSSEVMKPYLTDEAVISITVASENPKNEASLMEGIEKRSACWRYESCGYRADAAVIEEAHRCGMSFGKYRAYRALKEQGHAITAEECLEMNMREIKGLLHENGHGNGEKRQYRGGRNSSAEHPRGHGKGR